MTLTFSSNCLINFLTLGSKVFSVSTLQLRIVMEFPGEFSGPEAWPMKACRNKVTLILMQYRLQNDL